MKKLKLKANKIKKLPFLLTCMKERERELKTPKYCFFLGAGCSLSSGIPLGGEIIEELQKRTFIKNHEIGYEVDEMNEQERNSFVQEYQEDYTEFVKNKKAYFQEKIEKERKYYEENLPENLDYKIQEDKEKQWQSYRDLILDDTLYGNWFEEFSEDPRDRQQFIEDLIEDKKPKGAYILFADIVKNRFITNIFTTNFDDLINEALLKYMDCKAKVYSHNEIAKFISIASKKPNIIKLHGDYLFENIRNVQKETGVLEKNMKVKFEEALKKLNLIVVGYGGADNSIMSVLEEIKRDRNFGLIWIGRYEDKLNWRIVNLINENSNSYFIQVSDFETLVYKIWNSFCPMSRETQQEKGKKEDEEINRFLRKFEEDVLKKAPKEEISESDKQVFKQFLNASDYFKKAYSSEKSEDRIKLYTEAIKLNKAFIEAYNNRGIAFYDLKEYEKAMSDFDKAIELNPEYASAYYNRGLTFYDLTEYEKAVSDFDKAIELDPEYSDAYNALGLTFLYLTEYEKAVSDFDKAIELNPENALAYYNRGLTFYDLKEYEKAMSDFDKAIELNPEYSGAFNNRAMTYLKLKKYDSARKDAEKSLKINPKSGVYYATLAEIYAFQGKDEDFYENIELALENGFTVWEYLEDKVYSNFKNKPRFKKLIENYKKKY